jgi:hypothetical protein
MCPGDRDGHPVDPFLVVASLHGQRLQITAGSALAAAAAARYWRELGAEVVDWWLREDLAHDRPVLLLFTHEAADVAHVTELIAGKPVSAHPLTCCERPLRWERLQVCTQEMARPCPDCLTAIRSAGLFSSHALHHPRGR